MAFAVEDGGERVTYRALTRCRDRVGAGLREAGVGRGSLVGIRMERGAKSVASLLGILKRAAPTFRSTSPIPGNAWRGWLRTRRVAVVLTGRHHMESVSGLGRELLCAEELLERDSIAVQKWPETGGGILPT